MFEVAVLCRSARVLDKLEVFWGVVQGFASRDQGKEQESSKMMLLRV